MDLHQTIHTMIDATGLRKPDPARDNDGVCFGGALALICTAFAGNMHIAIEVLEFIKNHYSILSPKEIRAHAQNLEKNHSNSKTLSSDILALLSRFAIAQQAKHYVLNTENPDGIFSDNKNIIDQYSSIDSVIEFFLFQPSVAKATPTINLLESSSHIMSRKTLSDLFNEILYINTEPNGIIALLISSINHTLAAIIQEKGLILIDVNAEKIISNVKTSDELSKSILKQLNKSDDLSTLNILPLTNFSKNRKLEFILSCYKKSTFDKIKKSSTKILCELYENASNFNDKKTCQYLENIYQLDTEDSQLHNLQRIACPEPLTISIAIYQNWDEVAYRLIWAENPDELTKVDNMGFTALQYSLINNKPVLASLLLSKNIQCAYVCEKSTNTALFYAIYNKHWQIASKILKTYTPDSYSKGIKQSEQLLHEATLHGISSIVKKLVNLGENVNSVNNANMTPLHLAAMKGHAHIVHFLISCPDIHINALDDKMKSAEEYAALYQHNNIAAMLKRNRIFLNDYKNSSSYRRIAASPYSLDLILKIFEPMCSIPSLVLNSYAYIGDPLAASILTECETNPSPEQLLLFLNDTLIQSDTIALSSPQLIFARNETVMRMMACVEKLEMHIANKKESPALGHLSSPSSRCFYVLSK